MITIHFKQHFTLRNLSKKTGKATLYHEFVLNGFDRFYKQVAHIFPDKWNSALERVSGSDADAKRINLHIEELRRRATEIVLQYEINGVPLNRNEFLERYEGKLESVDFIGFFERKLAARYGSIANGTYRQQKVTLEKLKTYRNKIFSVDLTPKFLANWEHHLRYTECLHTNTVAGHLKNLRTYINLAIREGYAINNPFKQFKIKKVKTNPVFLHKYELERFHQLYENENTPATIRNTLQTFLFACYTGPRISDLSRLTRENIQDGYLLYVPEKTKTVSAKEVIVSIGKQSSRLINEDGPLFNKVYSDQKMNTYLKEAAAMCGIDKKISTHAARHTFGFLLASADVPATKIKELMGHSNINTTVIYIHLAQNFRRESIDKLDAFMSRTEISSETDPQGPVLRVI